MANIKFTVELINSEVEDTGVPTNGTLPLVGALGLPIISGISKEVFESKVFDVKDITMPDGTKETAGLNAYKKGRYYPRQRIDWLPVFYQEGLGWLDTEGGEAILGNLVETTEVPESRIIITSTNLMNRKIVSVFFHKELVEWIASTNNTSVSNVISAGYIYELIINKLDMPFPANADWANLEGIYAAFKSKSPTTPIAKTCSGFIYRITAHENYFLILTAIERPRAIQIYFPVPSRSTLIQDALEQTFNGSQDLWSIRESNANTLVAKFLFILKEKGYIDYGEVRSRTAAPITTQSPSPIDVHKLNARIKELEQEEKELREKYGTAMSQLHSANQDKESLRKTLEFFKVNLDILPDTLRKHYNATKYLTLKHENIRSTFSLGGVIYLQVDTGEILPFHEVFDLSEYEDALAAANRDGDDSSGWISTNVNLIKKVYEMERKSASGLLFTLKAYSNDYD